MSESKPLQLLGKTGNQYEVITREISTILDRIGNKNVAIVSINGNKRTGKSFLLNFFLRFLKYNDLHGNEWINGVNEETLNGFHWRGGAERDTVGIWMWSEPFMVKDKYGNDIALLLLDTQGNFDDQTTFQECSLIFSLSLLMSTTLILNITRDLSEDKMQFVEFFTTFAEAFSGESQTSGALFQKLVFLVRDWENDEDFPFGYHDQYTPVSKNFMRAVVFPNLNQCLEAQNTRKEILGYFNHVSSYLMPHPGRHVSRGTFRGQNELMESDFVENIKNFVPIMLDSNNIEPKTIGGELLTGKILKQYLHKWAEVIRTHKIPEARNLTAATAEVNYILALKHSLNLYNTNMSAYIESKPTDQQLCSYHETAKQKSLDYFLSEPKMRISEERKTQMMENLESGVNQTFEIFRSNNNNRIYREETDRKLIAADAAQEKLQADLEKNKKENQKKITALENKIEKNTEFTEQQLQKFKEKKREILNENRKNEEKMKDLLEDQRRQTERAREDAQRKIDEANRKIQDIAAIKRETVITRCVDENPLFTILKGVLNFFIARRNKC